MSTMTAQLSKSASAGYQPPSGKQVFREKFQCSLHSCVSRGFSLEEAFGMIWVETWEEVSVTEQEQSELYDELIQWARRNCR